MLPWERGSPRLDREGILEALRAARERALARAKEAGERDREFMEGIRALLRGAWADMDRAHAKLQEALRRMEAARFTDDSEWVGAARETMLGLDKAMGHLLMFLHRKGVAV